MAVAPLLTAVDRFEADEIGVGFAGGDGCGDEDWDDDWVEDALSSVISRLSSSTTSFRPLISFLCLSREHE